MGKFICYCTVFALFCFEFEGNFQVQAAEAYIWRCDLTEGFLCYDFRGLIFGGAYFRNFTHCTALFLIIMIWFFFFNYKFDWRT